MLKCMSIPFLSVIGTAAHTSGYADDGFGQLGDFQQRVDVITQTGKELLSVHM